MRVQLENTRGETREDHTDVAAIRLFTLADARHFPGLVALVNSMRVLGRREPLTVLDLGFDADQREALRGECDFVEPPDHSPRHPYLLEPRACMARDAEVVVYVDADVIITNDLVDIVQAARDGQVILYTDYASDRWFEEWQDIFGLRAPLRVQAYANAGFLAFSTVHFPNLLERWAECCEVLVGQPTHLDSKSFASPIAMSSQDALNAILMSEVPAEQVDIRPAASAAQGPGELTHTAVVDLERLRCTRDGRRMELLHAWGVPKPWEPSAHKTLRRSAYLRCLRRLLLGDDVAVKVAHETMVPWLHPGARGRWSYWYLTQARRPWRGVVQKTKDVAEQLADRMRR
jgi:hypothetical protein